MSGWVFAPCPQTLPLLFSTSWLKTYSINLSSPLASRWECCHIRHIRLLITQSLSVGSPSGWLPLYWRLQQFLSGGLLPQLCLQVPVTTLALFLHAQRWWKCPIVTCSGTSISLNSALIIVSSLLKNPIRWSHPFPARTLTDKMTLLEFWIQTCLKIAILPTFQLLEPINSFS